MAQESSHLVVWRCPECDRVATEQDMSGAVFDFACPGRIEEYGNQRSCTKRLSDYYKDTL